MKNITVPLDKNSQHYLLFSLEQNSLIAKLSHSLSDRRSTLHNALKHNLFFKLLAQDYYFSNIEDQIILDLAKLANLANLANSANSIIEIVLGKYELIRLATVKIINDRLVLESNYTLSPFETRFLAQNGFPHPITETNLEGLLEGLPLLLTDLHTHFAGCVSAKNLIQIGIENNVSYPSEILELAGIRFQENTLVPLSSLSLELKKILEQSLCIPLDRRVPFVGMEKIYRLRSPITKNINCFTALCRQIAMDYKAMGAKYIELSFANSVYANYLNLIESEIPKIELETGLTIRFLSAIGRSDDLEWDLDYIEKLKQVTASRYIAGVDFLGHETNSTYAFTRQLQEVASWADKSYPGFVIRVHAGENPAHPENIRAVLEILKSYQIQIRIGHGLFGVDDETLEKLKKAKVIVEFNLNSNLALNNIQTSQEVPLKRYLDKGVQVVLGTDGYGIYQTSTKIEAQAALLSGITKQDFEAISKTELNYLASREIFDKQKPLNFIVSEDLEHKYYTPEVLARKQAKREKRNQALLDRLKEINIPLLNREEVNNLLKGKQVISFSGAWYKSWEKISFEQKEKIYLFLDELLPKLNINEVVIITGGTSFGIANVVQKRAIMLKLKVLATLVNDTPPLWLERESVSYTCLVGEDLYDKAAGLYQLVKEYNGLCLFIGGGNIVSDEIQVADNLRLNYLLMDGPEGASTLHAKQHPNQTFTSAKKVLELLQHSRAWNSTNEPYWHLGANPTVDIVLTRNNPKTKELEILLIRREHDSLAEASKLALPGGFQHTDAPRGTYWQADKETAREACIRELLEETSLDLRNFESELIFVGSYEGEGRDPRDTPQAWSRSTVFALHLPDKLSSLPIAGADDACDAEWIRVSSLPSNLAFDHSRIIKDGLAILKKHQKIIL
ncbi:MAG: NUDIX domain-containing protein [Acidobacteria bacterium]|nr:NUDIX domain-containing protein [Acidobacteriota bacterium]